MTVLIVLMLAGSLGFAGWALYDAGYDQGWLDHSTGRRKGDYSGGSDG